MILISLVAAVLFMALAAPRIRRMR